MQEHDGCRVRGTRMLWVGSTRVGRRCSGHSTLYMCLSHMRHVRVAVLQLLVGMDGIHGLLWVAALWRLRGGSGGHRWGCCRQGCGVIQVLLRLTAT